MKKIWITTIVALALLLCVVGGLWHFLRVDQPKPGLTDGVVETFFKKQSEPGVNLRVVTWNIAYAHGPNSEAKSYIPVQHKEMQKRLNGIARLLNSLAPDVVLLQEIDFFAKRSFETDQLAFLAKEVGLPYGARAISWDIKYLPFPYWPLENQFGRIQSGGAILSRFPLTENQVLIHALSDDTPFFMKPFFNRRYSQLAEIMIGKRFIRLMNTHLEAYDRDLRIKQAKEMGNWINSTQNIDFFGGDFNSRPEDGAYYEVLKLSDYKATLDNGKYTFPATSPVIQIDHLFIKQNFRLIGSRVVGAGELSDHLPVLAVFTLD